MTMKSIIAVASGDDADAHLLSVTAKLAAHFTAHLRADGLSVRQLAAEV